MMEGPRHQQLHQEWQEPLEELGRPAGSRRARVSRWPAVLGLLHPGATCLPASTRASRLRCPPLRALGAAPLSDPSRRAPV